MKNISLLFMFIAVILAMPMPLIAKAENLLENPGFELEGTGDSVKADSWDIWMGERLNEFKRSGDWSLHIWAFDGEGDGGAWRAVPISAGTKVCFQGYIMSPSEVGVYHKDPLKNGAEAFLEIEWFQGGSKLDSVKSETLKGPSVWKLYSVTATAPAGTDSARFVCKIKSVPGASGDIYFDDLSASIVTK